MVLVKGGSNQFPGEAGEIIFLLLFKTIGFGSSLAIFGTGIGDSS